MDASEREGDEKREEQERRRELFGANQVDQAILMPPGHLDDRRLRSRRDPTLRGQVRHVTRWMSEGERNASAYDNDQKHA